MISGPSASGKRPRRESERGFALLLVFLMAASVALMLYLQMPRVAFESERQKEQLLIDRGEQYKRAIQLFRVANNRFPTTLEELEKYQDKRYLRRRYKDPMTGKDEWRIVHTNGMFLTDSQVTKPPNPNDPNNQLAAGGPLPGGLPAGVNGAFPGGGGVQNSGQTQVPGQGAPGAAGPQEQNAAVAQRPSDRTMPGQTAGNFGNPGFGDPNQQAGFQPQPGQPQPGFQPAAQLPGGGPQGPPGQPQPGLQPPVFPQTGQVANGQQTGGDPQQQLQNQFQQNQQNQGQPNFGAPQQNDPFNNNNSNNPASFPPITLYPAGGAQQPGAQNNNQQFNPQFPGQIPGQSNQPQFPGQPVQPQFPGQQQYNGILGQPGVNPNVNQQQPAQPSQYRVDPATGALVPLNPGANAPQNGFAPISLPGQPGAAPGGQQNNPSFRPGGGVAQPGIQNQVRTPTAPGPVPQQGGAPNQALNLINQLLTTPRQPPAGVTSGQSLGTMQTNGIAGVASTSKGASIKRYKERGKYNEWEFVFEVQQPGANGRPGGQQGPLPGGLPGAQGPGASPTNPATMGQPNGLPSFIPQNSSPSILPQR